MTRRIFLLMLAIYATLSSIRNKTLALNDFSESNRTLKKVGQLGVSTDGMSYVYKSHDGSAEENTRKVIGMMGGIETIIAPTDIVILKPNGQWWNQGTTNTNSMKAFIELILDIPGFAGEIIIGENHHFPEVDSRGWTTEQRNGDFNLNEMIQYFQSKGFSNVTKYHWHDGGTSLPNMWGGAENGRIVNGPEDGDGYHWVNDSVFTAPNGRKAMMSYPIFTSQFSGITIDLKNGPWKNGKYLNNKLKFINFSALNSHGSKYGVTASIKNYLGICDMTCGFRGVAPKGYFNFHFIGENNLHWRLKTLLEKFGWEEQCSAIGGCVGHFMKHIKMADLNIVTAEWSGYGSRIDINQRAHTRTILASTDPVALDYISAKTVLLPATKQYSENKQLLKYHNPDDPNSPFRNFLLACHNEGIGNIDNRNINIKSYVFQRTTWK